MPAAHDASRRRFVLGAAAVTAGIGAAGIGAAGAGTTGSGATGAGDEALADLTAIEATARMQRGELPCERYAEALLARCRRARALNAFITLEPDRVLEQARGRDRERRAGAALGSLFGLPIPVKDSVNTRDYPTTAGTPALRTFRPAADAPVVAALKRAGAIVLGKTNLHELSYGWTSNNLAYGAVHNPYDPTRIPGGSSGGTAAAIAARLAPLGIAEDTEGSIRVPAAFCGIHGFRPTTGRYPTRGCVPISPLFDQVGPHARCVADLALFDSVLTAERPIGPAASLRGIRLGLARDYWFGGLDPEVERITGLALRRLADAGATLVDAPLPGVGRLVDLSTDQIQNHDVRFALARYLEEYSAPVTFEQLIERASPDIRSIFQSYVLPGGEHFVTEAVYADARDHYLPQLKRAYRDYFASHRLAAMVFPTTRVPPPRIGEETVIDIAGAAVPFEDAVARNIAPGSTAGLPGLVLPAGLTAGGLPVALEFDGPAGSDAGLLALGAALEQALGPLAAPNA
ncbi:MAG TPA: amidase family protein [Steroidobacteraceae bacterium]|nr:amidase family protein [Steroidobacteraceae bacterium]